MKETERLYDRNPYETAFEGTVLCCTETPDGYETVLDRTSFFPEQGGQYADRGTLNGIPVRNVWIRDGVIFHRTDTPLSGTVSGSVDWATRFDRMQNHSGEHILSGLMHSTLGLSNVGFHLNDTEMTLDFNGTPSSEDLARIEREANRAVWADLPVEISYPSPEELSTLSYRSKIEGDRGIRIVTIPGVDCCACCAPHVRRTGEIGCIKILQVIRYKGGIRMHAKCGERALKDYGFRYGETVRIAQALSVKQEETGDAVDRLIGQSEELSRKLHEYKRAELEREAALVTPTEGSVCLFVEDTDPADLGRLVTLCREKAGLLCAAFSGSDESGYRFALASSSVDLRARGWEMFQALRGRGGGSRELFGGSVSASRREIEEWFATFR